MKKWNQLNYALFPNQIYGWIHLKEERRRRRSNCSWENNNKWVLRDHVHWNDYNLDHTLVVVVVAHIDRSLLKIHEREIKAFLFCTHVVEPTKFHFISFYFCSLSTHFHVYVYITYVCVCRLYTYALDRLWWLVYLYNVRSYAVLFICAQRAFYI